MPDFLLLPRKGVLLGNAKNILMRFFEECDSSSTSVQSEGEESQETQNIQQSKMLMDKLKAAILSKVIVSQNFKRNDQAQNTSKVWHIQELQLFERQQCQ